jgi:hypothetical protein
MELFKTNENSSDPTPKLKSSPIPINFVPFNQNDINCSWCENRYTCWTCLFNQEYCKNCLLRYVDDLTDNNIYLDVSIDTCCPCQENITRKPTTKY